MSDNVRFLDWPKDNGARNQDRTAQNDGQEAGYQGGFAQEIDFNEEDIPF